ncbi:zinc finger protein 1035 [Cynoglossus semilaevis]|uniref:zinc finger protein 1035 n=1 Tax=Cynoglossus semilaevis TaxID=244447 RepID=UPI0007DC9B99|nr:uncharacterized protein LOC103388556 [Cynoglossus semilaevis]XP_016893515.1 uncharacterized protein LOC103388556 [Cynoglossus semilaevis]
MKRMARGWDSYLQNFPSASSNSGTLTRTSDSDNLETCIQHHDFTDPVASHNSPASSTNYFLNPSTENSGSDCVYQKHYGEMPWQVHGEQVEKHYLSSTGNGNILDFPTPFAPDFQELKQDCELLTAPFLEDYSDISSCSDADIGETRASWKFLASNSVLKCKAELGTKQDSSEWNFLHSGTSFTTEDLSPEMSDTCTTANISKPANMKAEESRISCPQDHLGGPEKYESCTKSNQLSNSVSIVTAIASESQEQPRKELRSCIDNITFEKLMEYSGSMQENVIATPVTTYKDLNLLSIQSFDEHNSLPGNMHSECQEGKFVSKMPLHLESQGSPEESKVKGSCDLNSVHLYNYKFKESGPQYNTFNSSTLMSDGQEINICDQKGQCRERNSETCLESHNSSKSAENLLTTLTPNKDESDSNVLGDNLSTGTFDQDLQSLTDPPGCLQVEDRTYITNSTDPQSGDPAVTGELIGPDSCLDTSNILKDSMTNTKSPFPFTSTYEECQNQRPMVLQPNCVSKSDISEIACISSYPDQCLSSGEDLEAPPQLSHRVEPGEKTTPSSQDEQLSLTKKRSHGEEPGEKTTPSSQDEQLSLPKKQNCGNDIDRNGIASTLPHQKQLGDAFQQVLPQSVSEDGGENANAPISSEKLQSPNQSSVKLKPQSGGVLYPLDQPQSQRALCLQTQSMSIEYNTEGANASFLSDQHQSLHQSALAFQQTSFDGETGEKANASASQGQEESGHSNNIQPQSEIEENSKNIKNSCLLDQQKAPNQSPKHPLFQNEREINKENVKLLSSVPQPQSLDQLPQKPERPEGDADNSEAEFDSTENMLYHDPTHPLKSCEKMRKRWQPVVIFNPLMSANARPTQYRCGACQYTTHDIDSLIEHRNNLHLPHSFQFCKVCSLFLVSQNEAENHVFCSANKSPQFSSNITFGQKEPHVKRRCKDCHTSFPNLFQYIRHMRTHNGKTPYQCNGCGCYYGQYSALRRHQTTPNRCKRVKEKNKMSDAITSSSETQQQKGFEQDNTDSHLPKCYVKLVDIFPTKMCTLSGTTISTSTKEDKHCDLVEMNPRNDATTLSHEKKQEVKNKTAEHKCPFCPKTFKSFGNRNKHLRDCVKNLILGGKRKVGNRYSCPLCTRTFASSSTRGRHIKISCFRKYIYSLRGDEQKKQASPPSTVYRPSKLFKCNECPAVFRHASGKYRHMKKHKLFRLTGKKFSYRNSAIKECEPEINQKKKQNCKDNEEPFSQDEDLSLNSQFCGKHFGSSQQLKNHEHIHKSERAYKCLECGKIFKTTYHLNDHKNMHKRRVQCTVCQKVLPTIGELIQHRHTHTEKGMLQCPDCPLQFQYPVYLLRHLDTHIRKDRGLHCKERSQINPQPPSQAAKEQCVSKEFKCSLCKKMFRNARVLRKHSLTHISKSNHCPFCHCKFSSRRYLLHHMMRHTGEKPYSCTHCGKQFYSQLYFETHSSVCLSTPTKTVFTLDSNIEKGGGYKCSHCPRIFRDNGRLTNHHKKHEEKSLIPCSCGQYFSSSRLSLHQAKCKQTPLQENCSAQKMPPKSSTTKKPQLKCPHCTKRFKYKSLLLRHLVTHKGDQSCACVHCGHKYKSRAVCLQHEALCERVSLAKVTNVTNDGSADDISKQSLEDAKQSQADTSELKCKFCTKTFTKPRSLRYHILSHNEVKPYRCKSCNSCFSRYDYLKVHQTNCNGKRRRLEVCIPKITVDDVGRGWKDRLGIVSSEKHNGAEKCEKISTKTKTPLRIETPTAVVAAPVCYTKNKINHCIKPCFNKKNKYICDYCPRTFNHSWAQVIHTRLHTGERPFACQWCGERFIRKDYVKRHLLKCTKKEGPEKVLCEKCGGLFSSAVVRDHISKCTVKPSTSHATNCQSQQSVSRNPPEGFSCAYCSSRFLLFSQLQEHFLSVHKLETVLPTIPVASLQHHLSSIHDIKEEPVEDICDKLVHDNESVNKSDTSLKEQHVCSKCNMTFINKAGLVGHKRIHSTDLLFSCKTCHKDFWNKNLLHRHYRKCNLGLNKVPLKAQIDLALDDSVLVFKDSSTATGSGVLQTSFSCKDDLIEPSTHGPETKKTESKYQCSECDKSFTDGLLLISHLEDHGREEQKKKFNKCPQCGRVCANQNNLERHMRTHAINQKFRCPVCSKVFSTLSDMESHSSTHDQTRPFFCKLCNQRFWKRPSLYNHYKKDHPSDAFACHLCESAYLLKKSLQRHYKDCHPKEQQIFSREPGTTDKSDKEESNEEESDSDTAPFFPCHVCGKTFHTSESLEDHQRCHLGEKPHECEECGKCFYQASQLQQHQRMHQSEFQCQLCGRGFTSLFALRTHKHTQSKNRPYRCPKCDISFSGPWQLREHINTHCEENFPCDVCSQVFLSKSSRAEHRKTHSVSDQPTASLSESSSEFIKEFKYRCSVCNERFKDPEHLSEHGCRAANERPYVCSDCNKYFLHSSHLKKHQNTHHPSWANTDYPCNLCKSSFSSPQHYLSHIETHMASPAQSKHNADNESKNSSNFKCPVCHLHFSSSINLISHFPTHRDIIIECKVCKMTFPSKRKLEEHTQCHCTPTMEFECSACRQRFSGREAFQKHHCSLQKHIDAKSDNMQISPEKPTSLFHKAMQVEEEEVDVTGDVLYTCPYCSLPFSTESDLLEHHSKEHQTNKSFSCETCGKSFALRQYLRKHERRHHHNQTKLPIKSFTCSRCHIKFTEHKDFSFHMRMHTEKRPGKYRCDMCYRSFEHPASLKRHQESHVGKVVYECTECDKAFAFQPLLEEHQQTHASSSR